MSLTYGYDLKDGDKISEALVQTDKLLSPFFRPRAPITYLPFCTVPNLITACWQRLTAKFSAAHSFVGSIP